MQAIIVEIKVVTFQNHVIFGVIWSDAGIEDGVVKCVVNVVGSLVVEEQRHRQTALVWQIRLYCDIVK